MQIEIQGEQIESELDFHRQFAIAFELDFYGNNLDALWDSLTGDVERPVLLVWLNSDQSRENMGSVSFDRIVQILNKVQAEDLADGWDERFEVQLR
jgi:ribonuclease inhibitor